MKILTNLPQKARQLDSNPIAIITGGIACQGLGNVYMHMYAHAYLCKM